MKEILSGIAMIVATIAILVGLSYIGYKSYELYKPRYVAVDNKVFHKSQQYNDGMLRDLENLQMEYIKADVNGKNALRAIILHRFSVYPQDKMSYELKTFYTTLRNQ